MDKNSNAKSTSKKGSRCHQVNALRLDGVDYDIKGLPLEEIVQDIANDVPADTMKKKWGLDERKINRSCFKSH